MFNFGIISVRRTGVDPVETMVLYRITDSPVFRAARQFFRAYNEPVRGYSAMWHGGNVEITVFNDEEDNW